MKKDRKEEKVKNIGRSRNAKKRKERKNNFRLLLQKI